MKSLRLSAFIFLFCTPFLHALGDPIGAPTPSEMDLHKSSESSSVSLSTTPLGSPFYRHLASDFDIPMKELVKFERKGFGRSEIVELVLISKNDVKKLKELGNRRIKDTVSMETLVKEAGLNYRDIVNVARDIKTEIESRGDKNLPAPVYDVFSSTAAPTPTPKPPKKKKS